MYFRVVNEVNRQLCYLKCNDYIPLGSIIAINSTLHVVTGKTLSETAQKARLAFLGHYNQRDFFRPTYHNNQFGMVCTYERQREIVTCWLQHDDGFELLDFTGGKNEGIERLRNRFTRDTLKRMEAAING